MKRILVISFSPLARDGRVLRQIKALSDRYQVTACGFGPLALPGVESVPVERLGRLRRMVSLGLRAARLISLADRLDPLSLRAYALLKDRPYDLVVANDVSALRVGVLLSERRRVPLLWDAHEWAPEEFSDRLRWRFLHRPLVVHRLARYLSQVGRAVTVSPGIARLYRERYGVDMEVVLNTPPYHDLVPVRRGAGEPIRLVHHGGAIPSRGLETMIEAVRSVDGDVLFDLYLVTNSREGERYLARLKELAGGDPRIRFRAPVFPEAMVKTLSQYDVGVYSLSPSNPNHVHALPNKLFEFIQARLAVTVSPNPEMARLVRDHGVGLVAEDFSAAALGEALRSLDHERINNLKAASHRAASELNAERESAKFLRIVEEMLTRKEEA